MARRTVIVVWLVALALAPFHLAQAQQPKKIHRIGLLLVGSPPDPNDEAFRQGLRDLDYVEGKNIFLEHRWAEGGYSSLPNLAAELVQPKVDVIITQATPASLAAKQITKTIPIVFVGPSDPVASGLIASFAHPGGNITGLTTIAADLSGKHLELLKDTVPGVTSIAALLNPSHPLHALQLKETKAAAQALKARHKERSACNILESRVCRAWWSHLVRTERA